MEVSFCYLSLLVVVIVAAFELEWIRAGELIYYRTKHGLATRKDVEVGEET